MFGTTPNIIPEKNKVISLLSSLDLNVNSAIIMLYCDNSSVCVYAPSRAWALYTPRNYRSCWHITSLKKSRECVKGRLRPDGGVSPMPCGRSFAFSLHTYHSGYAGLYCSNKQLPSLSDWTPSFFPALTACSLNFGRTALPLVIARTSWLMETSPWCVFLMITRAERQIARCFLKSLPFVTSTHVDRPKWFTRPYVVSKRVRKNTPILEGQEPDLSGQEY